ncbi:DNA polymerase III subunit delta [Legionella fairfieldensis]|uniref:DNA polymerase III subunit delta n=1 Tax=Legionella fairfieldensis TaxID=45064 RepID=UPI00048D73D2|nr:DNA polymerase III subunit delta [Legionella fairfieldensis]
MLIKQHDLNSHLRQKSGALYILIGQDLFFLQRAAQSIKSTWQTAKSDETETKVFYINNPSDWSLLNEEVNSYSLFATKTLLDIRYEKKVLDATGKDFLSRYLKNINPFCLLLLQAANLPQKQLQWLTNHNDAHIVQANPLHAQAMKNWIAEELQTKAIKYESHIPELIQQYTEGNMLACAQVIEKLELLVNEDTILTTEMVKEQLSDQCNYQLFELADACLSFNANKAIQILRHACHSKIEPTLILWLLTQEIRLLIQLIELREQSISFATACTQLKIWPQRARLYQAISKKIELDTLFDLLQFCKTVDERIKLSQGHQIWHALEQIALSLCLTRQAGYFA